MDPGGRSADVSAPTRLPRTGRDHEWRGVVGGSRAVRRGRGGVRRPASQVSTHRLLDLYLGVLHDPGRATVELRRMADRFPDTPDGQGALAELRRRRDHLAQDQTNT